MNTNSQAIATSSTDVLAPEALKNYGLTEQDLPAVAELASKISLDNAMTVTEFGRDVGDHTSKYADDLLAQVRNKDLDIAGAKLSEVVIVAQRLNLHSLSDERSRIPVIGPFIDRFKISKEKFVQNFDSTRDQVEKLVTEVGKTQTGLTDRIKGMEDMFTAVANEYTLLGRHVAAGKVKLAEAQAKITELQALPSTPALSQQISDLRNLASNLDRRVGNLQVLQQSAFQSLPMIRMIQANNLQLVEKFDTIKDVTVPAWKRNFMLALSLHEQKNAVELANQIDDATNDLLRSNADLLKTNSIATSKANQRLAIDVDTLQHVQNTLISTVQEVIKIQENGVRERREIEGKLVTMRADLQNRLTHKPEAQEAA